MTRGWNFVVGSRIFMRIMYSFTQKVGKKCLTDILTILRSIMMFRKMEYITIKHGISVYESYHILPFNIFMLINIIHLLI